MAKHMINTKIVSAFPGTGKTFYTQHTTKLVSDSDSSKFDKAFFPQNYIEHIKSAIGIVDVIFVSSHKVVRDALVANNLPFILIYPRKEFKAEYLERYKNRQNTETFVKLLSDNWDNWIDDCIAQVNTRATIGLGAGQFISDLVIGD